MGIRIVMAPLGSLGDLNPYLGVAAGLQRRGHDVTVATSGPYRDGIEAEGVRFHAVRPDLAPFCEVSSARRAPDWNSGTESLVCRVLMPHLEETYEDLLRVCRGKELLVGHTLSFALPLVAEKLGLPWVSVALQPLVFFSICDPPVLGEHRLADWESALLILTLRHQTVAWMKPVEDLRRRLGLAPAQGHPLFEGKFSRSGTLAWFSPVLALPQPDWPSRTRITGFPAYDGPSGGRALDPRLEEFLAGGEPPVVFTLGSSLVLDPGQFFEVSASAAQEVGLRAVLLQGPLARGGDKSSRSDRLFVTDFAPFSALLPRAAATVHHGGIGTTARALAAGRPMLIVPHGYDQVDNADRAARLGVAIVVSPRAYTVGRVASDLTRLLSDAGCGDKAARIAEQIRAEDGVSSACDALEEIASSSSPRELRVSD